MIIFGIRAHYSAIGGVENSIRNLLKVVSERDCPALMVCREPIANEVLDEASMKLPSGVELVTYNDEYFTHLARRLLFLHRGGESLTQIYSDLFFRHPSACIVVRHHMHVLAARSAGFRDIRYLVPSLTVNQLREELRDGGIMDRFKVAVHMWIDGWLQSRAFRYAKLFVFSLSMQQQVKNKLPKNLKNKHITKVSPGIDLSRFKPASPAQQLYLRQRLNLPMSDKLLLFVGRFVHAKGLHFLLDAMAMMPKDFILILVGEGACKPSMQAKIKSLGLESRVSFVGASYRPEDYYRACDGFVMSSTYEPLGQTILEAAACGMQLSAFSKMAGVDTATQELGLCNIIHYANELTAKSLKQAMVKSLSTSSQCAYDSKKGSFAKNYGWGNLLERLIE